MGRAVADRQARSGSDVIYNVTRGQTLSERVVRCDTFGKRGRGLMFRPRSAVAGDRVYLFVEQRESVVQVTIHMFFVFFSIGVLWLSADKCVVDAALARPFRPYYAPRHPAQYYIEGDPSILNRAGIGDQLAFG